MKKLFTLLLVSFFSGLTIAQEQLMQNPEAFRTRFSQQAEKTKRIQSEFTQDKYSAYFKEPIRSSGIFYYDQSGKMRWEQKDPEKHVLLITGEELRIWKKGKESRYNLASNRQLSFIKLVMMGTVNGDLLSSGKFDIRYFEQKDTYRLELTPKDRRMKNMFERIELFFDRENVRLTKMKMIESVGEYTAIQFINPIFNAQISQTLFSEF